MSVSIFTAVNNEGPYLLDWIAHYRVLGIDNILVYSLAPEDGTAKILDLLQEHGFLTHLRLSDEKPSIFVQAQKHFWQSAARERSDWLMGLDVREYINIRNEKLLLRDALADMPANVDAVVLPRQIFGFNGRVELTRENVLSSHVRSAPAPAIFPFEATYGKTIMRNKQIFNGIGFFRAKQKPPGKGRDLNIFTSAGQPLPDYYAQHDRRLSIMGAYEGESEIVVNYYPLRSVADYLISGFYSGPQNKHNEPDLGFWVENNFNAIENRSIQRFEARAHRERSYIRSNTTGLDLAIEESFNWHKDKLETLLEDPKFFELHNHCLLAANSEQPRRALAEKLYLLRQKQEDLDYETELSEAAEAERQKEKKVKRKRKKRREEKKGNP